MNDNFPHRSIIATHVLMGNIWSVANAIAQEKGFQKSSRFIPYSLEPFYLALRSIFGIFSTKTPAPTNYIHTPAFASRIANALIVALAVSFSLCFVFIPDLVAIFSQGLWVSLTALFVFTQSSGATLRAARDRLLGIFVGKNVLLSALLSS